MMKKLLGIMIIVLFIINPLKADNSVEIYLLNLLDEPRGFCIDIRGHKFKAKIDKELQAHTCYSYQGDISPDQGFNPLELTRNQFFLSYFNVCMEATSLTASANLKLGKCDQNKFQNFEWSNQNKIRLISNRKLCLTVDQGKSKKGRGGSPVHLIRNLSMETCSEPLNSYQVWSTRK